MARPIVKSISLATADADSICASQTPGGAGSLTLNGALVSGGVATLNASGHAVIPTITSVGDDSGRTFTVTGTILDGGAAVSTTITGANAGTATGTIPLLTITDISVDAATADAVTAGTAQAGATRWIPLNTYNEGNDAFYVGVSGTLNWTFQYTAADVQDRDLDPDDAIVYADSSFTSKTTSLNGNLIAPASAVRLFINSGSGTGTLTVIESGGGNF